tara:strand:+ start:1517 stop:1855 length:339 start_codon:yes stop_codon:yes gene_type:complete
MKLIKKLLKKMKSKRQIKRLDYVLHKLQINYNVDNLSVLREVLTKDWIYYYSISGFLDGQYFSIFVWSHKTTNDLTNRFDKTTETDEARTKELFNLFKKFGRVELDQKEKLK